jgi:hypothetical protein
VIASSPLLDFFKRGEVPRDVRMLAAEGAFAPRAHDQLAILVLLLEDTDSDVRTVAARTLDRIPVPALEAFLARSDVPIGLREFFADRGVFPGVTPEILADDPLIQAAEGAGQEDVPPAEEESSESVAQRLSKMGFSERLKSAVKGTREMRAILIRDPNKMIAASVLSSPKLNDAEIESFARMTSVSEDVLRIIGHNRAWMKNYGVMAALARNSKTPIAVSMNLLPRLNDRDALQLSVDRNVPEALRVAARKRVSSGSGRH